MNDEIGRSERELVMLTYGQAPGALAEGTVVEKINSNEGDGHQDGDRARVLSSIAIPDEMRDEHPGIDFFYFVCWDDFPFPVGITSDRIRPV